MVSEFINVKSFLSDIKSEEFKNRKTYNLETSTLKEKQCDCNSYEEQQLPVLEAQEILLFTTKTCPNCKIAKKLLNDAGIKYTAIDAEEQVELTRQYNIKKAPTLLVPNGGTLERYENVSLIKKFVEEYK